MTIKSGIYQILNISNNSVYIGQAVNLNARKATHFCALRNKRHTNKHLQNSYNIYGENNFVFEILEITDIDKQILTRLEQAWINKSHKANITTYNIRDVTDSNLGLKHTDETKRKIGNKSKGNTNRRGKQNTPESKIKCSLSLKGRKQSLEHVCKRAKTKERKIAQIDITTGKIITIWNSGIEIEQMLGIDRAGISSVCNGKRKTAGGYHWQLTGE